LTQSRIEPSPILPVKRHCTDSYFCTIKLFKCLVVTVKRRPLGIVRSRTQATEFELWQLNWLPSCLCIPLFALFWYWNFTLLSNAGTVLLDIHLILLLTEAIHGFFIYVRHLQNLFIWRVLRTSGKFLWTWEWISGFRKIRRISWLAQRLLWQLLKTGSLWRRQSQQSFNTLTPFNFLFLYECYMLA
jgi:hypothetical protein